MEILETLLAKKKADADSAGLELKLYLLTHSTSQPPGDPPGPRGVELRPPGAPAAPAADTAVETFKGRVVGPDGKPVAGATVKAILMTTAETPTVVKTDAEGWYTLALKRAVPFGHSPQDSFMFEAPGLARQVFRLDALANDPRLIQLKTGVTVTGRIVHRGEPLAGIEVALKDANTVFGESLGEWTATTDDQGRFRFADTPLGLDGYLIFQMTSLKEKGAIPPRYVAVSSGGTPLDAGDLEVGPAHRVAGRVVFANGWAVPAGTVVSIDVDWGWNEQKCAVDAEGRFEFHGVPTTDAALAVVFANRWYAPEGYRLAAKNRALNYEAPWCFTGMVDHDITDLVVLFERGKAWSSNDEALSDHDEPSAKRPLAGVVQGEPK